MFPKVTKGKSTTHKSQSPDVEGSDDEINDEENEPSDIQSISDEDDDDVVTTSVPSIFLFYFLNFF